MCFKAAVLAYWSRKKRFCAEGSQFVERPYLSPVSNKGGL